MVALMKSLCFSFIVLASFATLFSVADANMFKVGGNGDWAEKPHEGYISWAQRNRFKVNDTLYFKYAKGSDSVQQVTKADFDGCNIKNPIEKFDSGEDEVALNRPGPFYFISGNQEHCTKGQKLIVIVLGIKNQPKVPVAPAKAPSTAHPPKAHAPVSPAKAPSTAHPPKAHSPVSPAKAPSTAHSPKAHSPVSPVAPAHAPKAHSPVSPVAPAKSPKAHPHVSPANAPKAHSPIAPANSPKAHSPIAPAQPPKAHSPVSPSKAPATSPATHPASPKSPSPSHSPSSPPPPKSPSPHAAAPPKSSPAKPPKSSPVTPADPSPAPSHSTPPADHNMAPAPSPNSAANAVTVTSVMSTLFGVVAFTVLMFA